MIKNYIQNLPNDIPVKLSVESVFKKDDKDSCFRLECRICDGEHTGSLINIYMYRYKKVDGTPRNDTTQLLEVCVPGEKAIDIPSWKMQGKIFETTPWHPPSSKYQMYGRFKFVGTNDFIF